MDHNNRNKKSTPIKPAALKALQKSKEQLKSSLSAHHKAMFVVAPALQSIDVPRKNSDGRIWATPILLPSLFKKSQHDTLGLVALAQIESQLRIGHGHDSLEKLRKALGVKSFLARNAKERTNYRHHTRAEGELRRAQSIVDQWASIYRKNWSALVALESKGPVLRGLQELRKEDQILLGAWLEDEQYARPGTPLPWIWKVSPLLLGEGDDANGKVAGLVASWNEEGESRLYTYVRSLTPAFCPCSPQASVGARCGGPRKVEGGASSFEGGAEAGGRQLPVQPAVLAGPVPRFHPFQEGEGTTGARRLLC